MRGLYQRRRLVFAETDPSPVTYALPRVRATLSHKGRGEEAMHLADAYFPNFSAAQA